MKNILKKISIALLIIVLNALTFLSAAQENNFGGKQDYKTGIGVRLGGLTSGITVKHFTNPSTALEGLLSFGYRSFAVTGLYEKHQDINTAPGLMWLYGIGGHVGIFRYGGYYYWVASDHKGRVYYVQNPGEASTVAGVDFILGLDYKFKNAPFNLGIDIKPFFDFFNGPYGYFDGALSIRFAF